MVLKDAKTFKRPLITFLSNYTTEEFEGQRQEK
jgi:hypothetical protein